MPGIDLAFDLGRTRQAMCYKNFGFHVITGDQALPIADGGFVDRGARLLNDRKIRTLTSGVGTSLLAKIFRGEVNSSKGEP